MRITELRRRLNEHFGADWAMGQVTAPLSDDHSKQQAERLASIL